MRRPASAHGFATRPGAAERWINAGPTAPPMSVAAFSARLTIDVTPAMRQRLKLAAIAQNKTVADLMRALIDQHFPDTGKEQP